MLKIYLGIGCIFTVICYLMCQYHVFSRAGISGAEDIEDNFGNSPLDWIGMVFLWLPGLIAGIACTWREME